MTQSVLYQLQYDLRKAERSLDVSELKRIKAAWPHITPDNMSLEKRRKKNRASQIERWIHETINIE